jgi:hypothetical protein
MGLFQKGRPDKLAVQERDQPAKNVVVKIAFRAVVAKQQKFFGFARFPVSSLANLNDMWPELQTLCKVDIGQTEEYALWHNRSKLEAPVREGEQYKIISKTTPGFTSPMVTRSQRRSSISEARNSLAAPVFQPTHFQPGPQHSQ